MNKLTKKLKFVSIAGAVIICSAMSAEIYKVSATPRNFWSNLGNRLRNLNPFNRGTHILQNPQPNFTESKILTRNRNGLSGAGKFDPAILKSNGEKIPVPRVNSKIINESSGENPQKLLNDIYAKDFNGKITHVRRGQKNSTGREGVIDLQTPDSNERNS